MNVILLQDLPLPINKKSGLQDFNHVRKIARSDYYIVSSFLSACLHRTRLPLDGFLLSINVRHKEHVRYIRTNNPQSAYALHILQNRHEYGPTVDTLQLLKTCSKRTHMNCWEALYMQAFHQHGILIAEQQVSDSNPLYELINATKILPRNLLPVSLNEAQTAHP